jgi:hypothetical protein
MSNTITLQEPDVDTLMGTYLGIQLERAHVQSGPFTLLVQIPYVLHQTVYTYVDAAGVVTDWYRTARYTGSGLGPYSAAWPVQSQAGAGFSLTQYRHRLADAAGFNSITQATADATATNQVVIADFLSTELEPSFLGNTWEYQPTGLNVGQVRRVMYGGLQNGSGVITVERGHSNLTLAGTPIEFYGKLPPVRYEGRLGLNDLVNKVLAECWTIQKLSIPAVQNQRVYPVGTLAPWLTAEDQVVEVYYRPANSDPNASDQLMINWRWLPGGDNPGIEIAQTLNTGDTLLPQCYVPMSWWINTGTGFGLGITEGLQQETDRAVLPIMGMEVIGAAYVYLELGKWGLPDDQATFRQLRAQARAAANEWKRLTLQHPQVRRQHWPAVLTVRSRDNFGYGNPVFSTPG